MGQSLNYMHNAYLDSLCVCIDACLRHGNGCDYCLQVFTVAPGHPMMELGAKNFGGQWVVGRGGEEIWNIFVSCCEGQ